MSAADRLAWKDVYSRLHADSRFYGRAANDFRRNRRALEIIKATVPRGASVIDLGCGRGRLVRYAIAEGYVASGVEFSHALFEMKSRGLKHLPCVEGDITDLSGYKDKAYDVVTAIDVLEHLDGEAVVRRVLGDMCRMAKTLVIVSMGTQDPVHVIDGLEYHAHQVQHDSEWWRTLIADFLVIAGGERVRKAASWMFWGVPRDGK